MHEERFGEPGLGLELGEQPVDVVDVLGPFDLGDHHHVELVADLGHERDQIVEAPRRIEAVDPRPQLCLAEVDVVGCLHEAGACRLLVAGRDRVFEVAEQHVDGGRDVGKLGDHLGVLRREEVDHPARPERDVAQRFGRADGERSEEVLRAAHGHEGRSCRDSVGSARSGSIAVPLHTADVARLLLALEHYLLGYADRCRKEPSEPSGQQDLAGRRMALEARRGVDDIADRGEVVHGGVPDVPDERFAEVESDADLEVRNTRGAVADALEELTSVFEHHVGDVPAAVIIDRGRRAS